MACNVKPGDTQIDTVAHCGGDMRGNFFWTLTQTDRPTQWTEITPTWNRGMHNTVEALRRLERRFPFPVTSEHEDNGPEFINYAMAEMQGKRQKSLCPDRASTERTTTPTSSRRTDPWSGNSSGSFASTASTSKAT